MGKYFIKTTDEETANTLKELGYQLFSSDDGVYVFINDSKLRFNESVNEKKCAYTDKLCV